MFVGWDWASATHDVTVIDDDGGTVDRWAFGHNEAGWATFSGSAGHGTQLPVIIERSTGLVVDRLLAAGHPSPRCIRPPSTPPGPAGVPPARSPTRATATNSLTTCAPTDIGCVASPRSRAGPAGSCKR